MFSSPFSSEIGFATVEANDAAFDQLLPEEVKWIEKFKSISRRSDFAAGRAAARQAAHSIGIDLNQALLPSPKRFPIWPKGVIGSISHSHGTAIAAVAAKDKLKILGVDLELITRELGQQIENKILLDEERDWINIDSALTKERLISIFSAKECLYKALFPLTAIELTYRDVNCKWSDAKVGFECHVSKDLGPTFSSLQDLSVLCSRQADFILCGLVIYKD